jgi:uncharacterized protein (TIGR00255 family)
MIRSMTGYGEAERDTPAGHLRLEVKTVNHRFFNSSVKTPPGFDRFERELTEVFRAHVSRGHVSAYLSVDRNRRGVEGTGGVRVDLERARGYKEALEAIQEELAIPGMVDMRMLCHFGEIFRAPDPEGAPTVEAEVLVEMAEEAAGALVALREAEGARLHDDLAGRLEAMAAHLATVAERAPDRLVRERDRLRGAIRELTEQVEVDEDRLAREIAYLAERWDINEEIVRFRSHIELFREALDSHSAEPVGKRLGFLVQEMHREANTIGSKANDQAIAEASVALKEEVERLREQVENVE